ncbi:uncharacterized protein OCT59_026509 [Rhizophagus irregularis]|uniref:Uncharacterized protein n=2 Tax=Rhizophagus irregularis TaxID=588596 RepID=A0A015LCT1_RHIIW|nr:hypothetical protein RirG_023020 [Rhizophagus irregularis DAOM 197198w]UZO06178.1 hypothetical protein OCT59_026509 [Rhizophagus irregularis]GBC16768.1 hypothetical protein RIR_jg32658.t1 [Rhizophagus irregularis DAOM 181602=DAOM 197198]CAB4473607.1 unnamed protein product [Rhizophagus irregularis]CAB5145048.1 unnamed protein product [Rhizophagus irregularis]
MNDTHIIYDENDNEPSDIANELEMKISRKKLWIPEKNVEYNHAWCYYQGSVRGAIIALGLGPVRDVIIALGLGAGIRIFGLWVR